MNEFVSQSLTFSLRQALGLIHAPALNTLIAISITVSLTRLISTYNGTPVLGRIHKVD